MSTEPLSWSQLAELTDFAIDPVNGKTNAQSTLRLFGQSPVHLRKTKVPAGDRWSEEDVRVTLFRDNHAWCPYCQKIWLWLEEKQIPYRIQKVTMFCYGKKESWYKRKVPSGMLPAVELDGQIITESDVILMALERAFGVLYLGMEDPKVLSRRQLERVLFRAWCSWLCYRAIFPGQEKKNRQQFIEAVALVEEALAATPGAYFLEEFSTADVIFTPYVERMNASLYYYKGYSLRSANPRLSDWFDAMETRSTYRGTQSDFHTHVHDLPPQMGGCYSNGSPEALANQDLVDRGDWFKLPDVGYPEPANSRQEALQRVIKHKDNLLNANPADRVLFDEALRCALTNMMTDDTVIPPVSSDEALRYLRDRINVPRDMSIYAAKRLRTVLEQTAAMVGEAQPEPLPVRHRYDQNPANFIAG